MSRGLFITVEGGEGSGKTSLLSHLSKWLSLSKIPFLLTREPGGTALGEMVRAIFLDPSNKAMTPLTELLLMLAARVEHVSSVVDPALSKGIAVLCDRYVDSTIAYQAYGRGEDPKKVWSLATQIVPLLPDVTFYLNVPVSVGFERVSKRQQERRDRMEGEEEQFHENVRNGFLTLARQDPKRIFVIDASQDEASVAREAINILMEKFSSGESRAP
jgi:dTMP kinase